MGKAYKAPEPAYRRRLTISKHAIERFRERVEEEFLHRSDEDLANLLDARIAASTSTQEITDQSGSVALPSTIVQVACRNGFCYCVIRDRTCVTVLDPSMLEANFATKQWKRGAFNAAFSKLKGLTPAPRVEATLAEVQASPAASKLEVVTPNPPSDIARLGAELAQAMLDCAQSQGPVDDLQREMDALRDKMIVLLERKSAAEAAVKAAQTALNDAIANATRKP